MNPCQAEFEKFYYPALTGGVTFEGGENGGYLNEDVDIAYNIFSAGWICANRINRETANQALTELTGE